jgi:sulfonate dioxygenase
MQTYLSSLTALHSAKMQADGSIAMGRAVRRDPVVTEHPLIRTNPVTGWKSLFFNPGFVTQIVGVPKMESDVIINYLNEIVSATQEMHVRFQWGKDDVAFWDNRVCVSFFLFSFWGVLIISVLYVCMYVCMYVVCIYILTNGT